MMGAIIEINDSYFSLTAVSVPFTLYSVLILMLTNI